MKLLIAAAAAAALVGMAGPPGSPASRVLELAANLPGFACDLQCTACTTEGQHAVIQPQMGEGIHGYHTEQCTPIGDCADHLCVQHEEDLEETEEKLAALAAQIESMPAVAVRELVTVAPERFSLNGSRAAVQVRLCPNAIALSVPLKQSVWAAVQP